MMDDKQRYNNELSVRVLDENSQQLGIFTWKDARRIATEMQLDLVMLNVSTQPPVCQITDAGRLQYVRSKNSKAAKQKQHKITVKEITMHYRIDTHDFHVKVSRARSFLVRGCNVKVTVQLRGRELRHTNLAIELCNRFLAELSTIATVQTSPHLEGRNVITMLSPIVRVKQSLESKQTFDRSDLSTRTNNTEHQTIPQS